MTTILGNFSVFKTNLNMSERLGFLDVCQFVCDTSKTSNIKLSSRLLDSVFFVNSTSVHWFFTTKNGLIAKKKPTDNPIDQILDRFNKFAMANPQNKQGYIGQIVESNGKRLLLGANELRETLMNGIDYLSENKSCVQVYLRPRNGRDVSYICSVSNSRVQSILGVGADGSQVDVMTSQDAVLASAKSQILEFISSLIQLFQYDNKIIENGSFHFIIDDNGHVWLSEISPMSTLSQSSEVANTSSETVELEMTSSSPNASSVRASSGERLSLVRNSQFLSRNAKGEFISRLGKDSLSGLAAWEMSGVGEDWKVNLATYSINAADLDQYHDVDNASRYPLPYPFVAFIRMCEPLLLAKIPLNSTEEFVDAWKRSFQKFCRDYDYPNSSLFSGSQNDVIVDGNIYSIVKKLQSLIQSGFEAKLSTQE